MQINTTELEEWIRNASYNNNFIATIWIVKTTVLIHHCIPFGNLRCREKNWKPQRASNSGVHYFYNEYVRFRKLVSSFRSWNGNGTRRICLGIYGKWSNLYDAGIPRYFVVGSSCMYSVTLALYFLLSIRYGWREEKFQTICCRFWF